MVDIYLQELMRGKISTNNKKSLVPGELQDPFEISLNQQIDDIIRNIDPSEFYSSGHLEPLSVKREKMRLEMKEETQVLDLAGHIEGAIVLIYSDEAIYDGNTVELEELRSQILEAGEAIKKLDLKETLPLNLKKTLNLNNDSIRKMIDIALSREKIGDLKGCLNLLILVSVIEPEKSSYWYRAGLAAQLQDNLKLALKFYTAALKIDTTLIGAKVFSLICCLKLGYKNKSREIKEELEKTDEFCASEMWKGLMAKLLV